MLALPPPQQALTVVDTHHTHTHSTHITHTCRNTPEEGLEGPASLWPGDARVRVTLRRLDLWGQRAGRLGRVRVVEGFLLFLFYFC